MEKEARFIIKHDKYSLLIIQLIDSNNKIKKGISIYNKTLEIYELNEDNINMALNKKDKLIYSFANLGLIDINGIKCFIYCSEKDVKEIGIISFTKIYQILNLSFLILEDMDIDTTSKLMFIFQEHIKEEVKKGLFFAQDVYNMDQSFDVFFHRLYEMNKNICHINPNYNFCYNNDYISYMEKLGFKGFTTHVISGYFNQSTVSTTKKVDFIANLIVKDKDIHIDSFIKDNEIKQIEIILCPNNNIFLNQIFHFIFYAFVGYYVDAKKVIYDLLKKEQSSKRCDNGAIIVIDVDNIIDNISDKNTDNIKIIEKELNQILGEKNKVIIINRKKEIAKIINNNKNIFSEIKYNYEYKGDNCILEFQEKQLLIISDDNKNLIKIAENILNVIKYQFLEKQSELRLKIKSTINTMLDSYKEFKNSSNQLNGIKLRVEAIDEKYLKDKIMNKIKWNLELIKENAELNHENSKNEEHNKNIIIINDNIESKIEDIKLQNNQINEKSYIYIVTFNTANYNFENTQNELVLLNELLFPKEIEKLYINNNSPIFYVIGLQEIVKLNTSNVIFDSNKSSSHLWEAKITEILLKVYNYTLQYKENMVGILLLIFVKSSEVKNIKNMKKSAIKAGFLKKLGNKGYILYEFKYKNKTFSFGSGHLTAGENDKNYKNRTNLLIDILNHKHDKSSNKLYENDFYFLFGDMNFRVKIDRKEFFDFYEKIKDVNIKNKINDDSVVVNKKPLYILNEKFELNDYNNNYSRKKSNSFGKMDIYEMKYFKYFKERKNRDDSSDDFIVSVKRKIDEGKYKYFFSKEHLDCDELNGFKGVLSQYNVTESTINFLPTYKYIKKLNYYDISKRTPGWTDRILYKKSNNIKCIKYDRINIKISDHRPVFGLFEINV